MKTNRPRGAIAIGLALASCAAPERAPPFDAQSNAIQTDRFERHYAGLLLTGEPLEGWNREGVDLSGRLRALPGGAAAHWLQGVNARREPQLVIASDVPLDSLIPGDWRLLEAYGEAPARGPATAIQITPIDERYIMVARANTRRSGSAVCAPADAQVSIYIRPNGRSAFTEPEILARTDYLRGRFLRLVTCSRYDEIEPGVFAMRYFTEDGRPFTTLNAEREVFEIVPAGAVDVLLGFE